MKFSLCHKLKFLNRYIFATKWCKDYLIQKNLKFKVSKVCDLGCKDIEIRKKFEKNLFSKHDKER